MKIALVYDRINQYGGAERILQALHQLYPRAPLYTAVYNPDLAAWAEGWDIRPSFVNRFPGAASHHRRYVMAMPYAFEGFDFRGYDLVISVTSAEAKGIITPPGTTHLCYLLTPTRYLWHQTHSHRGQGLPGALRLPFMAALRRWDYVAAQRPDLYVAISQTVADRCRKYYRRPVKQVIYPPVDVERFRHHPSKCIHPPEPYYLVVSRLVPYKRVDQVIEAFASMPAENLVIVGTGPEMSRLKSQAQSLSHVSFREKVSDEELSCLYHHATAVIFPQEEDFGIVAVEAQAAGTPVIAFGRGGAAETVITGQTGLLYDKPTPSAIIEVVTAIKSRTWDRTLIRQHAGRFDHAAFIRSFSSLVESTL